MAGDSYMAEDMEEGQLEQNGQSFDADFIDESADCSIQFNQQHQPQLITV